MNDQRNDETEPQAAKLAAALKKLPRERIFVPPYVDDSVLKAARKHLEHTSAPRWKGFGRWMLWPAFALLVLVGWLAHTLTTREQEAFAREDVNRDGRVDIVDALVLAREIDAGRGMLDLNGDGVVDRRDAEVIATDAVKLTKSKAS